MSILFEPVRLGELELANRIVMAPMTRSRADNRGVPTAEMIEYYRQHGELTTVDGVGTLDEVFVRIVEAIAPEKAVG